MTPNGKYASHEDNGDGHRTVPGSAHANQCCGSGSGAILILDLGSCIRNRYFPDSGSQTRIFDSLMTNFWVKSTIILSLLQFYDTVFVATKMVGQSFFSLLFIRDAGFRIRIDLMRIRIRIRIQHFF